MRSENGKSKDQGLRMLPKQRRRTEIFYNHEINAFTDYLLITARKYRNNSQLVGFEQMR